MNDSINIYNGYLSDIKIFDHALTDEEILAIYNTPKPWYKRLWRWIARIFR